jgi:hypothetical protein
LRKLKGGFWRTGGGSICHNDNSLIDLEKSKIVDTGNLDAYLNV